MVSAPRYGRISGIGYCVTCVARRWGHELFVLLLPQIRRPMSIVPMTLGALDVWETEEPAGRKVKVGGGLAPAQLLTLKPR